MIDPKGYLVTNAHVIQNANNIAVQNAEGKHFKVKLVHLDEVRDIAILKIDDSRFKSPSSLPYSIKKSSANIAESVFTLGYPRNDIVYGEGYLAAKTGYNGDTLSCQIAIAANPGNSGAPIINRNGEVIGVISTKQASADGAVFAVQSKYIYQTINELLKNPVKQKDSSYKKIKLPTSSSLKGMDRTKQAEKISDFVYMVKVS
ncbi:MAG TPA: serine protease [Chitinophagaceae bacterium]